MGGETLWICDSCSSECRAPRDLRPGWCPHCGVFGTFHPAVFRATPTAGRFQVATAAELVGRASTCTVPAKWRPVVGEAKKPFALMSHGAAGSGKSTLGLLAALELFEAGVYLSAEEGLSATLQARLRRLEAYKEDLYFLSGAGWRQAFTFAEEKGAEVVIIDSLGLVEVTPWDVVDLVQKLGISAWLICHETKSGGYRGASSVAHAVDVVISCEGVEENGAVKGRVEKSRFGGLGCFSIGL